MKIKKGDTVEIIAGNDRGLRGKVLRALPKEKKVVVEGVNVVRKHSQESGDNVIEKSMPIDVSNVLVVDPETDSPTRIGYEEKDGEKYRVTKKSGTRLT